MSHNELRARFAGLPAGKLVLALALSLATFFASAGITGAQETAATPNNPTAVQPVVAPLKLDLASAIGMALQQQPRIAAQRCSLCAAQDACCTLEALRLLSCLDPEIPIRRRQAALGVQGAMARVDQAERETVYAVTHSFVSVLYAREQMRVAEGVIERLGATRDAAAQMVKAGQKFATANDVDRTTVYIRLAEVRRIQAEQGVKRALAALKEAIGCQPDCCYLDLAPTLLGQPLTIPTCESIVALALSRRAEICRASTFADTTCLEVEAQGTCCACKHMETFAAFADIHGLQVPNEVRTIDYRPGAVPPEMPVMLAGPRADRMRRAQDFNCRACAVLELVRHMVALEAQTAFLRWEEAVRQVAESRQATESAEKLADDLSKDFTSQVGVKVEDVINARVLASQSRAQYNESLYNQMIALADLERATGGAFAAGLALPPAPPVQVVPGKEAN